MKKLLFVFNPVAGRSFITGRIYDIINFYAENDYIITVFPTGVSEKFKNMLSEVCCEFDLMVCAGGDGTLNNVISCLMETNCKVPISYLPIGTTNDFAKTLGYSLDFSYALKQSCGNNWRKVDVGKFNNRYFVYVAAFGCLAEVSYSTSQWSKNVLGHFAYVLNGIKSITELKSYFLEIEYEEKNICGEFCMGMIMNSLSIGGFRSPVSEDVILDDGLFEVLLIRMPQNISELQEIIINLIGQHINSSMFVYIQTGYLKIKSDLMRWTLDGEFGGKESVVQIWNKRKAITILGKE